MTGLISADRSAGETSLLVLADRLLTLAQQADRAGYATTAQRLVRLACAVFDERPVAEERPAQAPPRRTMRAAGFPAPGPARTQRV